MTVETAVMEWETESLPELVSPVEVCQLFGVHKSTLVRWRKPGSGVHGPERTYMIPARMAGSTPVWVRSDVERFLAEVGRQRAPIAAAS